MIDYQVSAAIDSICKKFGVTVEYLYPKIVHYCTVMSIAGIICSLIVMAISIIVTVLAYRYGKKWVDEKEWRDWEEKPSALVGVAAGSIGTLVTVVTTGHNLYWLISVLASPEVTALRYIMSGIK